MTTAIIQARMGSSRLPQKVLADISGRPMVEHVINRVRAAKGVDHVMVATTDQTIDNPLVDHVKKLGIAIYRGSANDVLDRYYQATTTTQAQTIVRITADCPLMDPKIIDLTIQTFSQNCYDHVSTAYPVSTFPDGLDVWVFSKSALERAWKEATLLSEREHVTPYMWKNPHIFKLASVKHKEDLSALRWTVDEPSDLAFVRKVYHYLGHKPFFGMDDILTLLKTHPELQTINNQINRDEGYIKSLEQDTL